MTTAIGYVRRSKESNQRTISIEEQRAQVAAYCASRGWALVETLEDDGISGGRRQRLVRLAERVRALRVQRVVIGHIDRLARDTGGLLDSIRALAKRGVEVHDVTQGRLEVQTSNGLLTTGVHALLAEHYRVLVSEKTRAALGRMRATGRRYSNVTPYGWQASGDGLHLEHEPIEQAGLALIRQLAPGRTLWALSAALAERGVFQRNGRPWQAKSLSRLLSDRPIGQSAVA